MNKIFNISAACKPELHDKGKQIVYVVGIPSIEMALMFGFVKKQIIW